MTGRSIHLKLPSAALLSLALLTATASVASAHLPDPILGGDLFAQDQLVEYKWRSGQVPPLWMREAINEGATDSNASRRSRAAVFAYDSAGRATVGYDEPTPCGALGAACANRSGAPASFDIWFRRQGWMFDWGALRWCEAYTTAPNGCYDAEAIALHEFGHAEVLDHHDLLADQSDYRDSVMNPIARSKPQPYYATRSYAKCDLATLQRKYDVPDWAASIALCQSLDTYLTFAANDLSTGYRDPVTFTAVLRITDLDAYGRLGYNPLAQRSVTLQRRVPGSTTWQFVTHMAGLSSGIGYASTQAPSTTYEWRAVFLAPDDEGLQGATSPTVRVTVGSCSGSGCPQVVGND